ncbi:hypothetical protein QBC40DRAFT_295741 [Triangularia verruculosa]|uniref:Uncharacterized protein n=1 Tax=Triangularia verruculosa TaxID=2587418 RepID=A0AAN6XIP3_9PEZI|nr:hypothetical protein QBC40DRAFT_295741 [Triangularia verruculosa]
MLRTGTGPSSPQNGRSIVHYERPTGGYAKVKPGEVSKELNYTDGIRNAYTTTYDLAGDFEKRVPAFIKQAQDRMKALIMVIAQLRRELHDAKIEVVKANQRLHAVFLHENFHEDPADWFVDEQTMVMSVNPADISPDRPDFFLNQSPCGPGYAGAGL